MNRIQQLFSVDGRIEELSPQQKMMISTFYSILSVTQWRYIYKWLSSQGGNRNPWVDGMPWVTYGSIDFLNKILKKNLRVFEFGSGGSTIYFSNKAKELVSIEHNKDWYEVVKAEINKRKIQNCEYRLVPAGKRKIYDYFRSTTEIESSFENYVKAIREYPDHYFDIVSVDGRARVQCVIEAYEKVKPGGYILLDNSERKDYFEAHMFLKRKGAKPFHFFGLVGYEPPLAQTTLWKL